MSAYTEIYLKGGARIQVTGKHDDVRKVVAEAVNRTGNITGLAKFWSSGGSMVTIRATEVVAVVGDS